jgi:hypothetical protein
VNRLISFFKQLRLAQVLTVFIAGLALFLTTACNNGNLQGARPDNPPVQAGGMNNPYKAGGDSYNNYKMSPDPKVSKSDRASLPASLDRLIADKSVDSNSAEDLLYPGTSATRSNAPDIGPVGPTDQKVLNKDAQQVPAQRQPIIDRSDPNQKILEKTGRAFRDASEFIKDSLDESSKS